MILGVSNKVATVNGIVSIMNYIFYGANFLLSIISFAIPSELTDLINVVKKLWSYCDIILVPINIVVYIIQFLYRRKMPKNNIHWSKYTVE
jgi:hypothetical protein